MSKFYIDNPTILETKVGDMVGNVATIATGSSGQKALNVSVDGGTIAVTSPGLPAFTSLVNVYADVLVPFNTETTIISYTVPVGKTFYITGMRGWGDTSGEFFIKVDGAIVGGDRTTAAVPSCRPDYIASPIPVMAGHTVTVTTIMYVSTTHTMRANLIGGLA